MPGDKTQIVENNLAQREVNYTLHRVLQTPASMVSLSFGHSNHLFTGSEDGILRVYDLSSYKVVKAVRGLKATVASVVCLKRPGSELRDAWISCGRSIYKFKMDTDKMIQEPEDVVVKVDLTDTDNDEVNEISINHDKTHLAFSLDTGIVGVVELEGHTVKRMGNSHASVCTCVKFIPERPRELVSGGYDYTLMHFNCTEGHIMTRRQISTDTVSGSISLSPPFIMSTAISPDGIMVAGTADGRIWLGYGGQKVVGSKKKKFWGGLDEAKQLEAKVAEGPIVAMAFLKPDTMVFSTMLGVVTMYDLEYDLDSHSLRLYQTWQGKVKAMEKVNALICDEKRIVLAGVDQSGKGVVEIWNKEQVETAATSTQSENEQKSNE